MEKTEISENEQKEIKKEISLDIQQGPQGKFLPPVDLYQYVDFQGNRAYIENQPLDWWKGNEKSWVQELDNWALDLKIHDDSVEVDSDNKYKPYIDTAGMRKGVISRAELVSNSSVTLNLPEDFRHPHAVFTIPKFGMVFDVNDQRDRPIPEYLYNTWQHPLSNREVNLHMTKNNGAMCGYLSNCMSTLFHDHFYENEKMFEGDDPQKGAVQEFTQMVTKDNFKTSDLIVLALSNEKLLKWSPEMERNISTDSTYKFDIQGANVYIKRKVFDRIAKANKNTSFRPFFREYLDYHYPSSSSSAVSFANNTPNSIIVGLENSSSSAGDNYTTVIDLTTNDTNTSNQIIDLTVDKRKRKPPKRKREVIELE